MWTVIFPIFQLEIVICRDSMTLTTYMSLNSICYTFYNEWLVQRATFLSYTYQVAYTKMYETTKLTLQIFGYKFI